MVSSTTSAPLGLSLRQRANGSKEGSALTFLPYLEMGWTVVNVSDRLADVAHAPAAVEDCRCALRWVYRNAEQYGFDVDKVVVTGNSAGGHLALSTGFVPVSAGLDRQCPGNRNRTWSTGTTSTEELKVAAVVNWYGITDVYDLAHRPPGISGSFTEAWLGSAADRDDVAKRVSPTEYIRGDLPPVITIHGDADPVVPYDLGHDQRQLPVWCLADLMDDADVGTVQRRGHFGPKTAQGQHVRVF